MGGGARWRGVWSDTGGPNHRGASHPYETRSGTREEHRRICHPCPQTAGQGIAHGLSGFGDHHRGDSFAPLLARHADADPHRSSSACRAPKRPYVPAPDGSPQNVANIAQAAPRRWCHWSAAIAAARVDCVPPLDYKTPRVGSAHQRCRQHWPFAATASDRHGVLRGEHLMAAVKDGAALAVDGVVVRAPGHVARETGAGRRAGRFGAIGRLAPVASDACNAVRDRRTAP